MPRMDEESTAETIIRSLLLGNSGSGKTGALGSLAEVGYQLHIADFDRGTNILRNVLRGNKAALGRIEVEYFADGYATQGPKIYPAVVQAWSKGLKQLTDWTTRYKGPEHIIVVDSLNFATRAAFNWILQLANRLQAP